MKPLPRIYALFMSVLLLSVSWSLKAQDITAEESVRMYVDSLLERVVEIRGLYNTDRQKYFDEVDAALVDFIDFREAARGVMAKYSTGPNGATDEQLTRFAEVFKASMVDFYGSALAAYNGEQYQMLPTRDEGASDGTANVRMVVTTRENSRIELQYSMYVNPEGQWKMRNIFVEGVNLRRQYYSRFDSMMGRYGDIDTVIDKWASE